MTLSINSQANKNNTVNEANATHNQATAFQNAEQQRIDDQNIHKAAWRSWGPYLSERQ